MVLRDSHLKISEVHEVILVGGSSRIPKIQQLVKNIFDGKVYRNISSDIDKPELGVEYDRHASVYMMSLEFDIRVFSTLPM